ncbi:rod shape-determining protein MreC [Novosphingobium sp. 1949]|uniref:Cell shape-determining protein MreC n=1 Tax=Novosphingobium organovorum TaxID=2930092 RepID=A0ABT0B9Y2_9SPHN|nr:rod shape-determining protein MreC [Novosphingobium organovorum]MCJ2181847.1 rod shape-determining protein MreC [Novosphingobium organovorum]
MAPPTNKRSGYSRRAQLSSFLSHTAGVVSMLIGLVLIAISAINPSSFSSLRSLAADATDPAAEATAKSRNVGQQVLASVTGFFKIGGENARMQKELAIAKTKLVEARAINAENQRLKKILGITQQRDDVVAVTTLTASTPSSTRRFATIGAGSNKGIHKGMPVRSATGLIGRVLEVGATSSRVLLITDTESLVPVRRASDGVAGFAQGQGDGTLRVRLVNLGINPLRKGDVIVSSGSGGLYRPGTPMAVLTEILRDGAIARVIGHPSDTDFVMIENVWAPPPPPPLPAATGAKP